MPFALHYFVNKTLVVKFCQSSKPRASNNNLQLQIQKIVSLPYEYAATHR